MTTIKRKKSLLGVQPQALVRLANVIAIASLCVSANTVTALEPLDDMSASPMN